jgi:heat shock protein HslJ/pimeloyl-ACP methyl ester carboxylesterase
MNSSTPFRFGLTALVVLLGLTSSGALAQSLKPGFDRDEYIELLKVSAAFGDSAYVARFPKPERFRPTYRSPVVGLENRWDLWTDGRGTAVVSVRGTTAQATSWLANFYAAMVPAKGELQLGDNDRFAYRLADHPKAAVHVGWLVSTAILSRDILPKLDSCYRTGTRNVLVLGHSQGGAIAYLLTAQLHHLQQEGKLPADLRLKTYCSAGPKPGNLYFAYEYEALTQGGWAFNVVNAADWVPEVPFSIQTVNDFNQTNPFAGAKGVIKKQKFLQRIVLRHVYNSLSKPALKAQRNYQKYLGKVASKTVAKNINGYVAPEYYESNHYVRTGQIIVLLPDSAYYRQYPDSREQVFQHHLHPPYLLLTEQLNADGSMKKTDTPATPTGLAGTWELNLLGPPAAPAEVTFAQLYERRKPTLTFDATGQRVSGNTSCNSFNGPLTLNGPTVRFAESVAMTRMACPGEGERVFLDALKKVNRYALSGDTLTLLIGDIAVMRFQRQK